MTSTADLSAARLPTGHGAPAHHGLASRLASLPLPALLRLDAALCAGTGLLAAAAAPGVADVLGPDVSTTVVRAVGIALLVYAADLALVSRASATWVRRAGLAAGTGNVVWEVGTVGLVVAGAFSAGGAVVALAVAAVVGGLGLLQLRAARRPAGTVPAQR